MKRFLLGLLTFALLIILVTACGGNGDTTETGPTDVVTTPAPEWTPPTTPTPAQGQQEVPDITAPQQAGSMRQYVDTPTPGRFLANNGVPFTREQIRAVAADSPAPAGSIVIGDGTVLLGNFISGFSTEATGQWMMELLHGWWSSSGTMVMDYTGNWHPNPLMLREDPAVRFNPDGTRTYTFNLYTDNVWSDGTPITARDFVFSIMMMSSPASRSINRSVTGGEWVEGYFEFLNGMTEDGYFLDADGNLIPDDPDDEDQVGVPTNVFRGLRLYSDSSFSVTIRASGFPFVWDFLYQNWTPAPFHYFNQGFNMVITDTPNGVRIDNMTNEWAQQRINAPGGIRFNPTVTSGAYRLVSFDEGSNNVVLERNPLFGGTFDGFMPQIQTIALTNAPAATIMDSLRIGQIDMVHAMRAGLRITEGWAIVNDLGQHRGADFPRHGYGYLAWHQDHGPAQFPEVRRAIAWLLDRDEFARAFTMGWGTVQHGPYALTGPEFNARGQDLYNHPDFTHYGFNPTNAIRELEAGGWVLNSQGEPFRPGVDEWRYKDVTGLYTWLGEPAQEGGGLMRLEMIWAANDNRVTELLRVVLPPEAAGVGMNIIEELYPAGTNNIAAWQRQPGSVYAQGGERFRAHHIYTLAVGLVTPSQLWYSWSNYEQHMRPGFNTTFHGDDELHRLAWAMRSVDPAQPGWWDEYIGHWLAFQLRYNYVMPLLPLYADDDHDFVPLWLGNWDSHAIWDFRHAIQRAYDGRTR
jgi:peptide/nickel transport system substrate-binding protein